MNNSEQVTKKTSQKLNNSTIKMLSWLINGLCLIFLIVGFFIHGNVYLPILVLILSSTISLYNLDRTDLKKSDLYNLYFAAAMDIVALVLYFLQSSGVL